MAATHRSGAVAWSRVIRKAVVGVVVTQQAEDGVGVGGLAFPIFCTTPAMSSVHLRPKRPAP